MATLPQLPTVFRLHGPLLLGGLNLPLLAQNEQRRLKTYTVGYTGYDPVVSTLREWYVNQVH